MNGARARTKAGSASAFYYGWIIVGVGFVTLGIAFGLWYSFSVFFLAVIREFGWSRAAASSIFSIFVFSQALANPLTGHLQDRFGPRVVIPLGALVLTISLVLTSRAQSLWHFRLFYGVLAGVGVSLIGFSSHAAFIPRWFERKRGLAVGVAMSGIGFGMLFLIPLVERSIAFHGWRATYLYLALLVFFLAGPLNGIFARKNPEELNLRPDGEEAGGESLRRAPRLTMKIMDAEWAGKDWTVRRAIRTRRFWCLLSAFFCISFAYQGTLLHAISAMVDSGIAREKGAFYFGMLGMASSGGKVLLGYLSDIYGREKINTLGISMAIIGILCLVSLGLIRGPLLPLVFAVFFGVGYGAAAPLLPSVSADIFLGRSFGLIFAVIGLGGGSGGASGSFIAGLLHDVSGSYTLPLSLFCVSLFCSCILIWLSGPRKVRKLVKIEH